MARLVKRLVARLAVLGAALTASSAAAEAPLPADWLAAQVNERGQRCQLHAQHREAERLLLACGAGGVWAVTSSEKGPRFVRSFEFPGDAVGFVTESDGRLWVKLQVLEARPFSAASAPGAGASAPPAMQFPDDAFAPSPPVASTPIPAPPAPSAEKVAPPKKKTGRVVSSSSGVVVISLGSDDEVARGDRIELALEHPEGEGFGEASLSRESLAVGVVTHVSDGSAKVRLGINESVPVGAVAIPTGSQLTGSLTAPPRVGGIWSAEAMLRPFAALDELGAGMLLSLSFGRRFANNFHLRAVLDPLALADVENRESVSAVHGALLASYDSHYFEMGLGLGGQTVNEAPGILPGSGLSVAQLIRLGAQDGLNVSARTSIVLFHSEFDFGGMVASMQIPVSRGYWLLLGGGGGDVGYGFGEFGLRALLRGNGGAGSRFLTVTAGGAAVFQTGACRDFKPCGFPVIYGGPMAGLGYEMRF